MEGKKTEGKQKIPMMKIENESDRYASFSKRRSTLYDKASELVGECDVDIGIILFSPANKPHSFFHPTAEAVLDRFKNPVFTMLNLSKLEFMALDISGNNYLPWLLDAEIHLGAKGLGDTIKEGNEALSQDNAKAMIFLGHHLDERLKSEYLTLKDPF
ncbi:agamous-like MADS-box protein AGL28 [Nicotiana tabacum]|uniref:Agamous-like MADS-box protein AGL28 n=1 Tax=Nicotiana tabacum TaxID=4097 RepID=A0A1S3XU43_TOBAC|nr:PREDICTED: MADS-box transcription factor 16-like [Nicotiana tabacum]